jgi:anhydro-N-acetylmuramic acid kinase
MGSSRGARLSRAVSLVHRYFKAAPPKSLARFDFPFSAVDGLSAPEAAVTLVAFTAETVRLGLDLPVESRR